MHVELFRDGDLPAKSPSSTILDLFRPGKSRSRARTPNPVLSPSLPRPPFSSNLQKDAKPLSARLFSPVHHPRPLSADVLPEKETPGRVVVIRERVDDLVQAASKAAAEKRALRSQDQPMFSQRSQDGHAIDIIDPTDVVDLPSYAFSLQASIGNALGVDRSVGAAALADFLPNAPRRAPLQDEDWRRALLHQAVDLSMSSIPDRTDASSSSSQGDASQPPPLIGQPIIRPGDRVPSPSTPRLLQVNGDRFLLDNASTTTPHTPLLREDRPSVPIRAITPAFPLRSLPPPPRKKGISPIIKPHPTRFPTSVRSASRQEPHTIRRSLSTPLLSDIVYPEPLTPPPIPQHTTTRYPSHRPTGDSLSTRSHYSYDGPESPHAPRASFASLDATSLSNRPSLSVSQQSHVSSAFGARPSNHASQLAVRRAQSPPALSLGSTFPSSADRIVTPVDRPESSKPYIESPASDGMTTEYFTPPPAPRVEGDSHSSPDTPPTITGPFAHLDRTKPVTNTPSLPNSSLFASSRSFASKRSPRIPESTFELMSQAHRADPPSQDYDEGTIRKPTQTSARALDGMLALHIEMERDTMQRITNNQRQH